MEEFKSKEKGLVSLEASIALTMFIFLMLFMYSFFIIFEVRNTMAHATLASADSLALDAYVNKDLCDMDSLGALLSSLFRTLQTSDTMFADSSAWFAQSKFPTALNETPEEKEARLKAENVRHSNVCKVVRERFLAYLGAGSEREADKLLKRMHVRNGVEGLDFSKSKVEGSDLYITVQYTVDYEFKMFSPNGLRMEHTARSKLWKP